MNDKQSFTIPVSGLAKRMSERNFVDVVIVGAGASGLCAAQRLCAHDPTLSIAILEAEEERVGGRIHTVRLNDQPLELGAQWIHGKEGNPLWEYVNGKGIAVHPAANPDGEGLFYRTSDGARMPDDIKEETEKVLDGIHDDLDKFHRRKDEFSEEDVPESVGQFFEVIFVLENSVL